MRRRLMNFVPVIGALMVCTAQPATAAEEPDCALGARYFDLAERASEEYRLEDRYQFLERAVAACNRYAYWQTLGEVASQFGDATHNSRAAEAFVTAYDQADSPAEQARAIGRYAELLFHSNQRQRALTYVYAARNLDPDSAWITDLAEEISAATSRLTDEDVMRGLADMSLKPLKLRAGVPSSTGSGGSGAGAVRATKAINIPLTFEFNSTRLDDDSVSNVAVLARTLAREYANSDILFVGHSDERGRADYNMSLSLERARAVYKAVADLDPALGDRISVTGMGESEPLSTGESDLDHRANRRLEVIIR